MISHPPARMAAVFTGMLSVVLVLYWPITFDVPRSDFVTFLSIVDGLGWDSASLKKVITTEFFGDERFQPLAFLFLYAQWKLFGPHVAAYHLLNEMLHVANAFVFYRILLRIHHQHWFALATATTFLLAFSVFDVVGWPFHSYILCQILLSLIALELVLALPGSIACSLAAYLLAGVQMYFYEPGALSPFFLSIVHAFVLSKDRRIGSVLRRVVPLAVACYVVYGIGLYLFSHIDEKTIIEDAAYRNTLFDPLNLWSAIFKGLTGIMDGALLQNFYLRPHIYMNELVFLLPSWLSLNFGDQLPGAFLLMLVLTALLSRSLFSYYQRKRAYEWILLPCGGLAAAAIPLCFIAAKSSTVTLFAIAPVCIVLIICAQLEWGNPLLVRFPQHFQQATILRLYASALWLELIIALWLARASFPSLGGFLLQILPERLAFIAAAWAVQLVAILSIFCLIWLLRPSYGLTKIPAVAMTLLKIIVVWFPAAVALAWVMSAAANDPCVFEAAGSVPFRCGTKAFLMPYAVFVAALAAVFAVAGKQRLVQLFQLTSIRRLIGSLLLFEASATVILLSWVGRRYFEFDGSPYLLNQYRWYDYLPVAAVVGLVFAARAVNRVTFAWLAFAALVGTAYISVVNIGRPGWYSATQSRYVYLVTLIGFAVLAQFIRPHFRRLSEVAWPSRFVIAVIIGFTFLNAAKIVEANNAVETAMRHVNRLYAAAYQFLRDPAYREDGLFLAASPYLDHDRLAWGSDIVMWLLLGDRGLTNSAASARWALLPDASIVSASDLPASKGPNQFALTFGLWPSSTPTGNLRVFGPDPSEPNLAGQWFVDLKVEPQEIPRRSVPMRLILGRYDKGGHEESFFVSREFSMELQRETVMSLIHRDGGFKFVLNGELFEESQDRPNADYANLALKLGPIYRMAYRKPYYYNRTFITLGWTPPDSRNLQTNTKVGGLDRGLFQGWPLELDGYRRREEVGRFYLQPDIIVDGELNQGGLRLQGDGWGNAETWGTWTIGGSATLLPLPLQSSVKNSDLVFQADVRSFIPTHGYTQIVRVFANGVQVASWLFTEGERERIETVLIPHRLLEGQETLLLSFEIPNAVSPLSLGLSKDPRKLGVGLKRLTVKKAQRTPVSVLDFDAPVPSLKPPNRNRFALANSVKSER